VTARLVVALLGCIGCGTELDLDDPCTLRPTLSAIRTCTLSPQCTAWCHAGGVNAGGELDMSQPYPALVDVPSRGDCAPQPLVTPGSLEDSLLWLKVTAKFNGSSPPCGDGMPLGADRPPLTEPELYAIREWILAGANDD
jgi:hypothetical protein